MPFLGSHFSEWCTFATDARIGKTGVDLAEFGYRSGETICDLRLVAYIAFERGDMRTELGEMRHGIGVLRFVRAPDAHISAGLCEAFAEAKSYA